MALPLIELNYNSQNNDFKKITEIARKNRIIGMIKKDIHDIEEDIKNDTNTLFTILTQKGENSKAYGRKLAEELLSELNNIKLKDTKLNIFKDNFYKMSKKEVDSI